MAVIVAIHTKTSSKLSYIDIILCFEASLFTTTIGTQYDDYRNHTTIIGTTKQSQKYVFFRKFDVFHGKTDCDCEDKTYSNCYVLKYSEIVVSDTLQSLPLNVDSNSHIFVFKAPIFDSANQFLSLRHQFLTVRINF